MTLSQNTFPSQSIPSALQPAVFFLIEWLKPMFMDKPDAAVAY